MAELEVAKLKLTDLGLRIDISAAEMIKCGYLDDRAGGGSEEDVDQLVVEETLVDGKLCYFRTIAQILAITGLTV